MKRIPFFPALAVLIIFSMIMACKTTPPAEETLSAKTDETQPGTERTAPVDLYVLSIGINEYSTDLFPNLKYAVNDAKNICEIFKAQEGKVFRNVNTMLIADNEETKPTKDNILSNLDFFKNVRPNDAMIIFIASHRIILDDMLYIMSSDSGYFDDGLFKLETFVNMNEILMPLFMPAQKIIILDTSAPEIAIGRNFTVLRACKEDEQAIEKNIYDGGLLTTSILEAFEKVEAKSGAITLDDLFGYVVTRVAEMSDNKQTPVLNAATGAGELIMGLKLKLTDIGIDISSSN